ncbi:MAG: DUF2069 domain-containing protein [Rhodoferax sp.]
MPPEASPLPAATRAPALDRLRTIAVACLLGLIAVSLVWELWAAPLRPGGSWLALKALPLCLPLAGLLRHRLYTYRWVSLAVWLYFTEGVVRAASDAAPSRYWALGEVALCVGLFVACVLYIRARLASAPPLPQEAP